MVESDVELQEALRWGNDVVSLCEGSSPEMWCVLYTLVD